MFFLFCLFSFGKQTCFFLLFHVFLLMSCFFFTLQIMVDKADEPVSLYWCRFFDRGDG